MVSHLTEKENIQKIEGHVTQPSLNSTSLYNLCEIPKMPTIVKFEIPDCWRKAQEVSITKPCKEIYQRSTQYFIIDN